MGSISIFTPTTSEIGIYPSLGVDIEVKTLCRYRGTGIEVSLALEKIM